MDQKTWLCRKKASEKTILATLEEVIPKEKELDLENSLKILNEELASVVDECSAKGTTRITLRGNLSKVAYAIALALCQGGIQVYTILEDDYKKLKENLTKEAGDNLVLSKHNAPEEAKKQYDHMLESKHLELSKHLKEISQRNDQAINDIRGGEAGGC
ncbi:hypothetical protein ACS0TY_025900 [Phlomoides rotata]